MDGKGGVQEVTYSASEVEIVCLRKPVMELYLVRIFVGIQQRRDDPSVMLLKGRDKPQRQFSCRKPANLTADITSIEFHTVVRWKYGVRIAPLNVAVAQEAVKLATDAHPQQKLVKSPANGGMPPSLVSMCWNGRPNKGRHHDTLVECVVSQFQMHVLEDWVIGSISFTSEIQSVTVKATFMKLNIWEAMLTWLPL